MHQGKHCGYSELKVKAQHDEDVTDHAWRNAAGATGSAGSFFTC